MQHRSTQSSTWWLEALGSSYPSEAPACSSLPDPMLGFGRPTASTPAPAVLPSPSCLSLTCFLKGAPQGHLCHPHQLPPKTLDQQAGSQRPGMLLQCEGQALGWETRTGDQRQAAGCAVFPSCRHPRPTAQSTALCKLGWSQNIKSLSHR